MLAVIGIIMTMTCKDNSKKKDIGNILLGFAILMFGMETMSGAVAPLADNEKFTGMLTLFSNPLFGLLAGTVLTAVIQSSSATTVMVVGFVNSGIMQLSQAVGIIMGANIGTTATSWLLSLTGIQGDSFFINMLKPMSFLSLIHI